MSPEHRGEISKPAQLMTGPELVDAYAGGEVLGSEVMTRCLDLAGRGHLANEPLNFSGNPVIQSDGQQAKVKDYIDHAQNHGPAINVILGFVQLNPDKDPKTFAQAKEIVAGFIDEHFK